MPIKIRGYCQQTKGTETIYVRARCNVSSGSELVCNRKETLIKLRLSKNVFSHCTAIDTLSFHQSFTLYIKRTNSRPKIELMSAQKFSGKSACRLRSLALGMILFSFNAGEDRDVNSCHWIQA